MSYCGIHPIDTYGLAKVQLLLFDCKLLFDAESARSVSVYLRSACPSYSENNHE